MPFSIRPYRRFPVPCFVTYHERPFPKLPLISSSCFWLLITLLLLCSGPAYAEWMSLGTSDSGTTVYADPVTIRREGDLVKMVVLFDFKTKQTKADVSFLSAKAQMEYDCVGQRFEGLAVTYFSGNMGNGNLLDRSSGKGKWIRISRDSLDQALWKLACDKK